MAELRDAFPDLAPSAIKAVLDSLAKRALVESSGDSSQVYLGGVHWWSTAVAPAEQDLMA